MVIFLFRFVIESFVQCVFKFDVTILVLSRIVKDSGAYYGGREVELRVEIWRKWDDKK